METERLTITGTFGTADKIDQIFKILSLLKILLLMLPHVHLGLHQDPQVLFCQAAFQPVSTQLVLVHVVAPPPV